MGGWRRAAVIALTGSALLASGCTSGSRWTSPKSSPSAGNTSAAGASTRVSWKPCTDDARQLLNARLPANMRYDCGSLTVPADWHNPGDGKTFSIALMRARATNQSDRIGSLLVNPGGPGGSGVDLAAYLSAGLPAQITRRFDIVGFDPRGVGKSTQVKCISDANLDAQFGYDPDPASTAGYNGAVALSRTIGAACGAKYGESLRLFSTEQAARDIDAIRASVGDTRTSYLGYSYGTLLGATYAQLFPRNIRALVLDGAVDPTQDAIASSESQAKGFEHAFDNFAAWCRTNATCPIRPDARAAVSAAINSGRTAPVAYRDGRKATAGWVMVGVISSLYSESSWPQLAQAIASLRAGDAREIFALADSYAERDSTGHYSNLFDANAAVSCADEDKTPTIEAIRTLQGQWRAKYPLFGAALATGLLGCATWPGKHDPYPTGAANGAPPIVVVGTTGDPATPYEQTGALAKMLGTGRVLTWNGEGHTAYPQTPCITAAVDDYLISLKAPGDGKTCPAQ